MKSSKMVKVICSTGGTAKTVSVPAYHVLENPVGIRMDGIIEAQRVILLDVCDRLIKIETLLKQIGEASKIAAADRGVAGVESEGAGGERRSGDDGTHSEVENQAATPGREGGEAHDAVHS